MDPLKEAFLKIKEDIFSLRKEINELKGELNSLRININKTDPTENLSQDASFSNNSNNPTKNPTQNTSLETLKTSNYQVSIGNEGVPTNRQTDQQTDQQTNNLSFNSINFNETVLSTDFEKAQSIISSLDDIKKNIRRTFKKLTPQEMLIFSTLYYYEEQKFEEIDYKLISNKLNLSESSIRDYINRLIKKGIPIEKKRMNNKKVTLSISNNLKNITNLTTIIKLRNL